MSFTSQKNVPSAPDEIRCLVYGTEGIADTDYTGAVTIRGKHPYEGGRMTNLPTVVPSVRSNLTSILGCTAAYRGREVSWSDIITECEPLKPDLTGLKS